MKVLVGTSGWVYKDWAKRFYPKDLKASERLPYFAKHFPTVEINSTFYRLPSEATVKNWHSQTPDDFVFAIKLSRYLTHQIQLKPGDKFNEGLNNYFSRLRFLGDKIGCVLVQLPASSQADINKITNLCKKIKETEAHFKIRLPLAFESRHRSWQTPKTISCLKRLGIANVIASSGGYWPQTCEVTADFAYIRFHGSQSLYASSYSNRQLRGWADFINRESKACSIVYCYFNNDKSAKAVENADYLASFFNS